MESHKEATTILGTELIGLVERERQRSPVTGKGQQRILGSAAPADLLTVASVFRGEHLLLVLVAVVAVGPAEVVPAFDLNQLFSGVVGVHLRAEAPVVPQLIPAMHSGV